MKIRTGIGYDIHRLVEDRKLFIGGVEIPYIKGLLGHSDGDVLLHAICDALLGALALGDIGEHFPDTDQKYLNISSIELLKQVSDLIKKNKFQIQNIDTIVIAEEPMFIQFKDKMRLRISGVLGISKDNIEIKAKTNEGLGAVGKKEAIASYAVAVLMKEE